MERKELDQLMSTVELLLSPKIETLVDRLMLYPLPNLLAFQELIGELIEDKKAGIDFPDLKDKEWYTDDVRYWQFKYSGLLERHCELQEKYLELLRSYKAEEDPKLGEIKRDLAD